MTEKKPASIDEYILQYSQSEQLIMQQCKETIQLASPQATQKMSWGMPTFYLYGNLVHFAMNQHHLGFYPGESGVEHFKERLTSYKCSKGAIQFPLHLPIPYDIIQEIVLYRTQENLKWHEEALQKKKKNSERSN